MTERPWCKVCDYDDCETRGLSCESPDACDCSCSKPRVLAALRLVEQERDALRAALRWALGRISDDIAWEPSPEHDNAKALLSASEKEQTV